MKFKVSSKALYSTLSGVSKVINSKNTLSILDNFLLKVEGDTLTVTASDSENTLSASLPISDVEGGCIFCLNARRISDIAKELPDVDVLIELNEENFALSITFPGGSFDLVGLDGRQYPMQNELTDEASTLELTCPNKQLIDGFDKTLFAVGNDELRPQMMGILLDIKPEGITFVATDTRKLVRYINNTAPTGIEASCILPVKPAVILKSLLDKEGQVHVVLSARSAVFTSGNLTLQCRFIKGNYPDYNRVIPTSNPFVATVDRASMLTAVRRVSVCADPAHGLVKFRFMPEKIQMKVDDANVNSFAHEEVSCDFTGENLTIGFCAGYLLEIFSVLSTDNILIALADPSRPGLFRPEENGENTDLVIILMPMTVGSF